MADQRDANPSSEEETADRDRETPATSRFVPIELPAPSALSRFEIVRPDGQRGLVPQGSDAAELREILRLLEELSC